MNKTFLGLLLVFVALVALTEARNYAVIVAGSDNYSNYRHQSDCAHAVRTLLDRGFKNEDIITFMVDDIANHARNPFPGATYNTPSEGEGINYYKGIRIDYSGSAVTPENFLAAIVGNNTSTLGPTLNTGPDDNILIIMNDHGSPGLFAFPNSDLYVKDFKAALDYIHSKNKARKVLIDIEACESGSMCLNVIPPGANTVCLTASDHRQSSWGKYCGSQASVNGVNIGSCLADEFAWALTAHIETAGVSPTIGEHYEYLKAKVERSPVQWFAGDDSFKTTWKMSEFYAQVDFTAEQDAALVAAAAAKNQLAGPAPESVESVPSRDMDLHYLSRRYLDVDQQLSFEERIVAGEELLQEIGNRVQADRRFTRIASSVLAAATNAPNAPSLLRSLQAVDLHTMESDVAPIDCGNCCVNAYKFISKSACKFTDYSLKYGRTIHNMCTVLGNTGAIMSALQHECQY